jgi:hypothetical protein
MVEVEVEVEVETKLARSTRIEARAVEARGRTFY